MAIYKLSDVHKRYKQVLIYKDKKKMTYKEIGELLGVSKQRAYQLYLVAKARQTTAKIGLVIK